MATYGLEPETADFKRKKNGKARPAEGAGIMRKEEAGAGKNTKAK
ncbi:MAG: hypothetical protein AB7D42_00465 [Candidatus Methanomethylophilaceae archaeon]